MARPNKHRRSLNRMNALRQDLTEVRADGTEERRPLAGYEEHYEITRQGEFFSKRLGRFIKHKFFALGDCHSTYIEFTIGGVKTKLKVGQAVADAFLSPEDVEAILQQIPSDIESVFSLYKTGLIDRLAKEYRVTDRAIFAVMSAGRRT